MELKRLGLFIFIAAHDPPSETLKLYFINNDERKSFALKWKEPVSAESIISIYQEISYGEYLQNNNFAVKHEASEANN